MNRLAVAAILLSVLILGGCMFQPTDMTRPSTTCPAQRASTGDPMPLRRVPPMYPAAALRDNVEGRVLLEFDLSREGLPVQITSVASEPEGYFEQAAITMMKKWRWCQLGDDEPDYPRRIRLAILFSHPS